MNHATLPSRQSYEDVLDYKNNSFNALRLLFAVFVVIGHSSIVGYGEDALSLGSIAIHDLAVDGFFVISGILITRSAGRSTSARNYFLRRALRIYPGYWVALIITAAVVAPLAAALSSQTEALSFGGAIGYAIENATLIYVQPLIDGTFAGNPTDLMNGSLWTLFYEAVAYGVILVVAMGGFAKDKSRVLLLAPVAFFAVVWLTRTGVLDFELLVFNLEAAARLGLMFSLGAAIYSWRGALPASQWLVALAIAAFLASSLLWEWRLLGALPFAYLVAIAGAQLPLQRIGRTRDISYGLYLYAWPVQQLLVLARANDLGIIVYTALCVLIAAAMGYLSWTFVESPALRLKRRKVTAEPAATSHPGMP